MKSKESDIVIYQTEDGQTRVEVSFDNDTVWLSLDQMADLFQRDNSTISRHIKNIFKEGELSRDSVIANFATTAADGKTYHVDYYNLDVIISVGYRVKSLRGTQFRRWALAVLKEYLVKGFSMNDDLLKRAGGGNYWRELLERIRDIRSSEKVFYRQILDLYATSADYDPSSSESITFFKIVQNKMHFAAHGHTASEIIAYRANAELPFMGLTTFSGQHPAKNDIGVAKNYLSEEELLTLNRMVSAFFDLAELRAMQHQPMYMKDWIVELDDFSERYGKGILTNAGIISHQNALRKAEVEYQKYQQKEATKLSFAERDFLESIKQTQKKLQSKKVMVDKEK